MRHDSYTVASKCIGIGEGVWRLAPEAGGCNDGLPPKQELLRDETDGGFDGVDEDVDRIEVVKV